MRRSSLVIALAALAACSTTGTTAAPGADAPSGADAGAPLASDASAVPPNDSSVNDGGTVDEDAAVTYSQECIDHCNIIVPGCAAEGYPQYGTMTACLNACSMYPIGGPDDWMTQADTLGCRKEHTNTAVMGGGYHCFHGGPFGYNSCGSSCSGLCRIAVVWCAKSKGGAHFASVADCMAQCETWPWAPVGPDGLAVYRPSSPTSGNTLECREVMMVKSLESAANRDVYCPLAVTDSPTCR